MSSVESTRFTKALGTCSIKVKIVHARFAIKDQQAAIMENYVDSFTCITSGLGFYLRKINYLSLCQFRPEPCSYACYLGSSFMKYL